MNHYELSIELLKVREWFNKQEYNDENTLQYFKGSVKEIHNYFLKSDWKSSYLFCSMGYYDNNKPNLIQYQYNSDDGFMNDYTMSLMDDLTQTRINKNEALSITEMFLHDLNFSEHYKALFYKLSGTELKNKLNEFIYLNLKEFSWQKKGSIDEFEKTDFINHDYGVAPHLEFKKLSNLSNPFLKLKGDNPNRNDIKEFNRLISIYLEIISYIDDGCFFYFLKPHTFQKEYNGIMVLGLKKELTPDLIEFWIDKSQRILNEIANKKMVQLNNIKAQTKLSNTSHILKTQIKASLLSQIQNVNAEIKHDKLYLIQNNLDKLFALLGLQNLVDKVDNKETFIQSAEQELLFCTDEKNINFDKIMDEFNDGLKLRKECKIVAKGGVKITKNNLFAIYGLFPEEIIIENFLFTIFENIEIHGEPEGNIYTLEILEDKKIGSWVFKNKVREALQTHIKKYTGSINVFNTLLKNSKSGEIIMEYSKEQGDDGIDQIYFNLKIIRSNET